MSKHDPTEYVGLLWEGEAIRIPAFFTTPAGLAEFIGTNLTEQHQRTLLGELRDLRGGGETLDVEQLGNRAHELAETWVNGNRKDAVAGVAECSPVAAGALAAQVVFWLCEFRGVELARDATDWCGRLALESETEAG